MLKIGVIGKNSPDSSSCRKFHIYSLTAFFQIVIEILMRLQALAYLL
jgi:hypothetical protein